MKLIAHLVNGKSVKSENKLLPEDIESVSNLMVEVVSASPKDGGYLSFKTPKGTLFIPSSSLLYVEISNK